MSLRVKLDAALIALGLDPRATQFDHDPALGLRPLNEDGTDTVPPQLDPKYITPRSTVAHRTKTTGTPPGQKVVHVANGDLHKIGKVKRLEEERLAPAVVKEPGGRSWRTGGGFDLPGRKIEGYKPDDPLPPEVTSVLKTAELATRSPWPKGRKMQSRPFQKKAKP